MANKQAVDTFGKIINKGDMIMYPIPVNKSIVDFTFANGVVSHFGKKFIVIKRLNPFTMEFTGDVDYRTPKGIISVEVVAQSEAETAMEQQQEDVDGE